MAAETVGAVKIDGYLEKKGKMKVVTTWKRYWFVLEGRLLLYYRSQEEYERLSPCKGSINMGLATSIRPGLATAGVFQIVTRTNTVTLRAKERTVQEKWLQALLDASGSSAGGGGQPTATNPIRMSHFRYSMDDLVPGRAKQQQAARLDERLSSPTTITTTTEAAAAGRSGLLNRQNTLPHRFNPRVHRRNSIIERIRQLGGQSYFGSATDGINRLTGTPTATPAAPESHEDRPSDTSQTVVDSGTMMMEACQPASKVPVDNDQTAAVLIENAEYISAEVATGDEDHNRNNCYLIENDQYVKSADLLVTDSDGCSAPSDAADDAEYYCTYEDISNLKAQLEAHIYNEPNLPPRPEERHSASEDCASCGGKDERKRSTFMKIARRFRSFKSDDSGLRKRSARLLMKVMGRKKSVAEPGSGGGGIMEPIYDTVDYYKIDKAQQQHQQDAKQLLQTLASLQQALEAKKSQIKDIIVSETATTDTDLAVEPSDLAAEEAAGRARVVDTESDQQQESEHNGDRPGLPPRRTSRPRSPFHDVPKNNAPIHAATSSPDDAAAAAADYSLDRILSELELESHQEELTVRALIDKFNQSAAMGPVEGSTSEEAISEVALRQKCPAEPPPAPADLAYSAYRHSDELNKLLEELSKVTSAPLLMPGVTSSLVQMRSEPLTDEEWLAIAPIRRRRHSEPDYDVPRPHRSLQILPRSPDRTEAGEDTVIPATRFFGPVLHQSELWRSMTPDSLEPSRKLDVEKDRCVGAAPMETILPVVCKSADVFLDSLEPFLDSATAF